MDEDGDGEYDLIYRAGKNESGKIVDNTGKLAAIFVSGGVAIVVLALIIALAVIRRKKEKQQITLE